MAGQEGFEPPTRGFGDRCSTVGATGVLEGLDLALFVNRVLPASRTELGQLELVLLLPAVLGRGVVALFADRTLHRDDAAIATGHGGFRPSSKSET